MISVPELSHILETAFLPMRCTCKVGEGNILVLQLTSHITYQVVLTVTGIYALNLTSSRAIANLVAEIKEEARLHLCKKAGKDGQKIAGHTSESMTKNYQRDHEEIIWSEAIPDVNISEITG